MIALREITENNYTECLNLRASVDNDNFVDSVTYSLAEAWIFYQEIKPFAIYNGDTVVGFVSLYIGEENYQIINFLIDDKYQKCGFGTAAATMCLDYLKKEYGANKISVPVHIQYILAQKFWQNLGFVRSSSIEEGYMFMRLFI